MTIELEEKIRLRVDELMDLAGVKGESIVKRNIEGGITVTYRLCNGKFVGIEYGCSRSYKNQLIPDKLEELFANKCASKLMQWIERYRERLEI